MATGGAWASETFDNGQDFQKARAPQAQVETPPLYNPPAGGGRDSSGFGVLTLILRALQIVFTLIALAIMAANKETIYSSYYSYYYTYYSYSTFKFSEIKAFIGIVALNCIVCAYAIVQLVLCFVNMSTKGAFISSSTSGAALLTFAFDTVLAYALVAASGAGADSAALISSDGCNSNKFCQKAQASVAMSFFAFAVLAACAALYPIRLLRATKG